MKGITLSTNSSNRLLIATLDPVALDGDVTVDGMTAYIKETKYAGFYLLTNAMETLCKATNRAKKAKKLDPQKKVIGEIRDANLTVTVAEDEMSATLLVEAPHQGSVPSLENTVALLDQQGVKRGVSTKRISVLLKRAADAEPGTEFEDIVAIGLPPRNGKPSKVRPLVPNALERVLKPQEIDGENGKVDMRNLGDILCVVPEQPVAERVAPSNGRVGYTVTDNPLTPEPGEWVEVKLGANTEFDKEDENIIIAAVTGQPKYLNGVMSVDDTFQSDGVNIGTGNVFYEGAVVIEGDVAESMKVEAKGDITINGFVESATIRSGGDIIITEGATGKMNEEDCKIIAAGSVFIEHGQGLDIIAGRNVNIKRQLAYSRVDCNGRVTIGDNENPTGTIFASEVRCHSTVKAGTVGAVSGSTITFDFSDGMNQLIEKHDNILAMLKQVQHNVSVHEKKLQEIHDQHIPSALVADLAKVDSVYESELQLMRWLEKVEDDLRKAKAEYEKNAKVIAYKEMYHGVVVRMNKRVFRAERDFPKCRIALEGGKFEYEPLA